MKKQRRKEHIQFVKTVLVALLKQLVKSVKKTSTPNVL